MKRNSLKKFLLSYLIVLLIPLTIGTAVYIKTVNALEEESNRANIAMLQQTKLIIDSRMQEIDQMAKQLILNKQINNFARIKEPLSTADIYSIINILKELSSFKNINTFIDDFYIYFTNSDVILTSSSKYDTKLFYNKIYSLEGKPYQEWYQYMRSKYYTGQFVELPTIDMTSKRSSNKMLTYVKSMSIYNNGKVDANIVILINENKVKELASNMASGGNVYIIDRNDNIIATSNDGHGFIPQYKDMNKDVEIETKLINGIDFNVIYTTSTNNNWKYTVVVPRSIYMEKVNYIQTLTAWIILLCLVVGVFISYIISYKNYVPIKEILDDIITHLGDTCYAAKNEMAFIQKAVSSTIDENMKLKNRLEQQLPALRVNFLRNLLEGNISKNGITKKNLEQYGIDFISDHFIVVLFIYNTHDHMTGESSRHHGGVNKDLECIFKNNKLIHNDNIGYIFNFKNEILALIMNFSNNKDSNKIREELSTMIRHITMKLKEYDSRIPLICIGNAYEGVDKIYLSYMEARKAEKYKLAKESTDIIFYNDICSMEEFYYYPLEMEIRLINSIKSGDNEEAERLIDEVIEKNLIKHRLSVELLQCLYFDITSTVIKVINEINENYELMSEKNITSLNKILECSNINEIRHMIKDICEKISVSKSQHKQFSRLKLKKDIDEYISKHYTEQGLNQRAIAEYLGVSTSYLSRFFKDEFGESMVDYINKIRINKVKEILQDDKNMSLRNIASLVGFNCDKALIRTFKKYEGITPGVYRDMLSIYK